MSDLTESFYQRLPAGSEMLRREKRKRNDVLEEMGMKVMVVVVVGMRDSTCISVPTTDRLAPVRGEGGRWNGKNR